MTLKSDGDASAPSSAIEVTNINVRFGTATVLKDVSHVFEAGRIIGIAGPNGSGKTTLMKALYGACDLADGAVTLFGTSIQTLSARDIARRVAVVPQFEEAPDRMRVSESVILGRSPHLSDFQGYSAKDHAMVTEALRKSGLTELAQREVASLSGGERQRVLLARALTQGCDCMLLDEPTNHLDIRYQHQLLKFVREVTHTAIIVLHDLNLVARYCDEVVMLQDGAIATAGPPAEVLTVECVEKIYDIHVREVWDGECRQFIFHG